MKVKDCIDFTFYDDDQDCSLCFTHEQAAKTLSPEFTCNSCNTTQPLDKERIQYLVVGETNAGLPSLEEEEINKRLCVQCHNCEEWTALTPTPLIYNANHDVYLTGSRKFINDAEFGEIRDQLQAKFAKTCQSFIDRRHAGEHLTSTQLGYWLASDLEEVLAQYLRSKGLKE